MTTWHSSSPGCAQAHRLLATEGTLYFHIDYREAHYCKVLLDEIFGRECFLNEIIWAYDYGARTQARWPAKHDTILVYVKDPARYYFDSEQVDREPYMAPGLVTPEKAARGKLPDRRLVAHDRPAHGEGEDRATRPRSRTASLRRIVQASSRPGDWCLDFFAGTGTLGAAARIGTPLRPDRLESPGGQDHAGAPEPPRRGRQAPARAGAGA